MRPDGRRHTLKDLYHEDTYYDFLHRRWRWALISGTLILVSLLGFVDEDTKHAELAAAWLALAPSVKEGWGLCVVEAASHGVPTIAYHDAGGEK